MSSNLLNLSGLWKMLEEAYRDGFGDGADHGNLMYKYPPEDIAVLHWRRNHGYLFGDKSVMTMAELAAIQAWDDASYEQRTNLSLLPMRFATEADTEADTEEEPEQQADLAEELRHYKEAAVWFAGDDTGVSSSCLVTTALGVPYQGRWGVGEPWDVADRGRCVRAIQRMPWILPALEVLEKKHWQWQKPARLIRAELAPVASEKDEKPEGAGSPETVAGSSPACGTIQNTIGSHEPIDD